MPKTLIVALPAVALIPTASKSNVLLPMDVEMKVGLFKELLTMPAPVIVKEPKILKE